MVSSTCRIFSVYVWNLCIFFLECGDLQIAAEDGHCEDAFPLLWVSEGAETPGADSGMELPVSGRKV